MSFKKKQPIFVRLTHLKHRMTKKNKLLQNIIDGIQEKKGKNINTISLKGIAVTICDYFVICEGNSPTQVSALAGSVEKIVKENTQESPLRVQGKQQSEWIGIDYGDIIVHIFIPELRSFYNLEHLWEDAISERIPTID